MTEYHVLNLGAGVQSTTPIDKVPLGPDSRQSGFLFECEGGCGL